MQSWRKGGDGVRRRGLIRVLVVSLLGVCLPLWAQDPIAIWPHADPQEAPRIQGHLVVWHQFIEAFGDYDVVVADVNRLDEIVIQPLSLEGDQLLPDTWGGRVVWQELVVRDDGLADWDISGVDVRDWHNPWFFPISNIANNDEQYPAISGNTVLWQDGPEGEYNIYGSDITDPNWPREFAVAVFEGSQEMPALDRTFAVWQDDFLGDWDVLVADIWLRDRPLEFLLTDLGGHQAVPAISGNRVVWQDDLAGDWDLYVSLLSDQGVPEHVPLVAIEGDQVFPRISGPLVVWQDNRFGHWDIYLANLNTGKEFRLTDDRSDQTVPDIDGNLVVWQDDRTGTSNIFVMRVPRSMLEE